jgi:hypothetical protein
MGESAQIPYGNTAQFGDALVAAFVPFAACK